MDVADFLECLSDCFVLPSSISAVIELGMLSPIHKDSYGFMLSYTVFVLPLLTSEHHRSVISQIVIGL